MTEQELLQENEKLNGRLQKAITVFGEQKATITRLTEERDSANADIEKLKKRIAEFEADANKASENDTKFFEQVNEIQVLNLTVSKLKSECENANNTIEQKNREIDALKDESAGFQMQVETTARMLEKAEILNNQKLKALNDIIEENKNVIEEYKNENEILTERLENQETEIGALKNTLANTQSKMDARVAELEAVIDSKDKIINDLQNKDAVTQTQISEAKTKIQEISRLGSDLITNFNMFA